MEERQPKKAKFTEASSSSTSLIGNNYYVFLSFRGPDTRKGFVDHLYQRLNDVGLRFHPNFVFRDDKDLPFGEDIATKLISAIEHSKVSIPVISENYAASEWCLRELIHIMKCQKKGQKVLTVFYKVKPSEVREVQDDRSSEVREVQDDRPSEVREVGAFGKAFWSKKYRFKDDVKKEGPKALTEAAASRVFESEVYASGYEGELVKELVRVIMEEQQHDFLPPLPRNLVEIDDNVIEVMKLADTDPFKTQIIGICGIGGVGKTTLATNIYNKLSTKFEHRSFLRDIRETINNKGIEHIQSLLISDITKSHKSRVDDSVMGIQMIQSSCVDKKVLILLDDVDRQAHLDKLIEGCNYKPGSRIIITCRDKALIKSEYERYELKEMNRKDSLLLFSRYAFEGEQPPTELAALSIDIVDITGGLPLALVIIGSLLKGKPKNIWEETLEKLKKVPNKDVQKVLRITYDSLEYEEQQMFLDIACLFTRIHKRIAIYLWNDVLQCQDSGLDRLTELSLIKFDDDDKLRMHDHLRDLGRAIACPANKKPWKCSRLWGEEAITVQQSKEENRNIEALLLDENGSNMFMKRESFKRMPYLKFLRLSKVDFVGDFEDSLSELRWLEWEKCPDSFETTNVHLEKLLILDLSDGNISEKWGGWYSIKMERLKVLNLSRCIALKKTPDLSKFESLEMLILESCQNLKEIHTSIGDVECLTSLNLSNCWSLKELPSQLGKLKGLVSLNLSSCTGLQELPSQLGELKGLVSLNLSSCSGLQNLPPQLGELKGLVSLKLSSCWGLEELPEEIGKLEKLKELAIDNCIGIKNFPPSIGFLKKLEILDALGCASLVGLPDSIGQLVNLSTLDLRFCYDFKGFPKSIGSLTKLHCLLLGNMSSWYYSNITPPICLGNMGSCDHRDNFCFDHIPCSIGKLESLTELHLTCAKMSILPTSIGGLKKLKILKISMCAKLSSLPNTISELGELEELDAADCESLGGRVPINGLSSLKILRLGKISDDVDSFAYPTNLLHRPSLKDIEEFLSCRQHLDLPNCDLPASLTVLEVTCQNCTLPELSHLIHLEELNLQFCEYLESIPVLPSGILRLWVFWCDKLKALPNLSSLELLSELHIVGCSELEEIGGLEGLKSLGQLSICGCKKLSNLKGLEQLEFLRDLEMIELDAPLMNDNLFQVQCFGRLKNLEYLCIDSCRSLIRPNISQLTHLRELWVIKCENIVEIKGLEMLKKLRSLGILECNSITHLSLLNNLEELSIHKCPNLHDVEGREKVKLLRRFSVLRGGFNSGRRRMNLRRSGNQGV